MLCFFALCFYGVSVLVVFRFVCLDEFTFGVFVFLDKIFVSGFMRGFRL